MKKKSASKKATPKIGVVASIIEYLKAGPITKEGMVTKLAKRFPDRSSEGMRYTVDAQVSRLKKKGFDVVRSEKGYAIK